ncbi:cortex morphogenetic protein CmpA [Mechercharimyces sp. CAU 1602]|nr:cortex morphogenetic protein CmpA [Mechercharimyces sp. CAU 1602]MCS1352132.1 cortex morphogenetic protein CmpA [Mechercharimyces sp. CAU 1602]
MPKWLKKQLMQAYYGKDRHQIRFLNDCWFMFNEQNKQPLRQEIKS